MTSRIFKTAALCALFTTATIANSATPVPPGAPQELVRKLRAGGLVIFVRHERTTSVKGERFAEEVQPDCESDNNLIKAGGERALSNNQAIAALRIPIGKVISSVYCRTRETATLMFGMPNVTPVLNAAEITETRYHDVIRSDALALIDRETKPGTNLVLVGHREGLIALAGADINTGDTAILEPIKGAPPRIIAFISNARWTQLAADTAKTEAEGAAK
jgi:phosphohistidine phosphatase SixA